MPQEASDNTAKNQEQVLDSIAIESIKERIKGLRSEIEVFTRNIGLIEESIKEATERFDTVKAIHKIMLESEGYKKIEPTYKYEQSPEYWELRKKEIEYQIADAEKNQKGQLSMADARLRDTKASLESSQKQLDEDLNRLKEAGVTLEE